MEDNKSKLVILRKSNSYKANLNRYRKRLYLKSTAGTLIKNSNNKPVVCKRWLVKKKYNLSTQEPILASNSGIGEIAIDNSKSPQPIIKLEGIY